MVCGTDAGRVLLLLCHAFLIASLLQKNDIMFECLNKLCTEAEPSHLGTINFIYDVPVWRQNMQRMHLKLVLRNVKWLISASKR